MKRDENHAELQGTNSWGESAAPPVLQRVGIRGRLTGPLLDVVVDQAFLNGSDDDIEVVYTFPLPPRAVLAGLEFELGVVRYSGSVKLKQQAEHDYEAAIAEGNTPVLVERNAAGLFTARQSESR